MRHAGGEQHDDVLQTHLFPHCRASVDDQSCEEADEGSCEPEQQHTHTHTETQTMLNTRCDDDEEEEEEEEDTCMLHA